MAQENTETPESNWKIPEDFRFRRPLEVVEELISAMKERSTGDQLAEEHPVYRVELRSNLFRILSEKYSWTLDNGSSDKLTFWYFLKNRVLEIASRYCDPDKAYDFDRYPDLENWTPESLKERMGSDYVEFNCFVSKEKFLIFLYKVLNLCCVRRVPIPDYFGSGLVRSNYYYDPWYGSPEDGLKLLKESEFRDIYATGHNLTVHCNGQNKYEYTQFRGKFNTWIDPARLCDVTFYAFASTQGVDDFSPIGTSARADSWFCAGKADTFADGKASLTLDFPDSYLFVPSLTSGNTRVKGFKYKTWYYTPLSADCYGYAVRDQRKYLKYFER
ncbi:MAG: hypothetical protein J6S24_06650 [Lentisphaeria bacterium]|nr:hypothetical protein [Lentisphaeria bacterium]MBO5990124.1 hypothetical protein [Lentisphaeria bacterium]